MIQSCCFMVRHQERRSVSLEIATQAGRTPVGFHGNTFSPTESCLGSKLYPGKTILTEVELQGLCSKCLSVFVFNVYTMEWMRQTTVK